jgi:tRNA-Thr(GGU) m(6)t(6)A37 methyltransferase TsaA
MDNIVFAPIGVIRTPHKTRAEAPIQPRYAGDIEGQIVLHPELAEGLTDLDGFSHVMLIYHMHLCEGYDLMVKPFMDDHKHGLFATRAPRRPNPIGISVVRLDRIEGHTLFVRDADMVDGSPLLDIKPYVRPFDPEEDIRIGWLADKMK